MSERKKQKQNEGFQVEWPGQSLDLNQIVMLGYDLNQARKPSSAAELK